MAKIKIERHKTAHGTNLVNKNQPIVIITFPNGQQTIMGSWTRLCMPDGRCLRADKATNRDILKAIGSDESVMGRRTKR